MAKKNKDAVRLAGRDKLGFVDYCRVSEDGKVRCYDKPLEKKDRRPRTSSLTENANKTVGKSWGGKQGSNLFTNTSKVHAPSWSLPAGAS